MQYLHRGKVWRYETTVRMPDGRKIRITGKGNSNTQGAAKIAEHDHVERTLHPERVIERASEPTKPTGGGVPTIRELIERYADAQIEGKPGAIRTRACHLKGPILRYFGNLPANAIKQSHLNAFRDEHAKQAAQTIRNKLYALLALLRLALDDELIEAHNLKVRVKERHAKAAVYVKAVAVADVAKLVKAAIDPRWIVALLLAAEAGLRIGEIIGAQWTDIRDGAITVRREIDDRNNLGPPKNGEERSVPLTPAIERALKRLPKRGLWLLTRLEDDPTSRKNVKRASEPGGHLGYSGLNKASKAIYTRAGVAYGNGINVWHSLRHTYGSRLVHEGVALERVRLLMGHKDVRTTQRYIDTTRAQLVADVRRVFG